MMHSRRRFSVDVVKDIPTMATKLADHSWCACQGFRLAETPLLLLNDSTGPDGAQEFAVFDVVRGVQTESITVSWMTKERLTAFFHRHLAAVANAETLEGLGKGGLPSLEHGEGPCQHCA